MNVFFLKLGTRGIFPLTIYTQHFIESFNQCKKASKRNKDIHIGKEEVKLFSFTDIIIYMQNDGNPQKSYEN